MSRAGRKRREDETILPTAERLAKGDIAITPIRYGDQRDADPNRPAVHRARKSRDNPLDEFRSRRLISDDAYRMGNRIGSLYERATREAGAINLDSIGGGSCDGLPFKTVEAMSELHALFRLLSRHDSERRNMVRLLIAVCGEGRSVREFVGGGGRACQAASNMLVNALTGLAREREAA